MSLKDKLTVIYYTANREDEVFEEKIRKKLLKTIGDLPLISVSQKPIDFGENICVGDVGISNQNVFRQFQIGCMHATTPFVVTAEADCLYPSEYFEFIPENISGCGRYDNVWLLYKNSDSGFVRKESSECAAVWGRENAIKHIEKRLKGRGMWQKNLEHGRHVPALFGRQSWTFFHGDIPVINIKTTEGMHRTHVVNADQDRRGVEKLPFWGTSNKIRKEMFS
jgi:hypothetical protein